MIGNSASRREGISSPSDAFLVPKGVEGMGDEVTLDSALRKGKHWVERTRRSFFFCGTTSVFKWLFSTSEGGMSKGREELSRATMKGERE